MSDRGLAGLPRGEIDLRLLRLLLSLSAHEEYRQDRDGGNDDDDRDSRKLKGRGPAGVRGQFDKLEVYRRGLPAIHGDARLALDGEGAARRLHRVCSVGHGEVVLALAIRRCRSDARPAAGENRDSDRGEWRATGGARDGSPPPARGESQRKDDPLGGSRPDPDASSGRPLLETKAPAEAVRSGPG